MSNTRTAVVKLLNSIEGMFPNWRKDEKTIILWHIALQDLSDEQIMNAIPRMLREHRSGFAPTSGEFMAFVEDGRSADLAYSEMMLAISRHGAYSIPIFKHDPKIAECIRRLGGWVKICRTREDELPFLRKDFVQIYEGLGAKEYPLFLSGMRGAPEVEFNPDKPQLSAPAQPQLPAPEISPGDSKRALYDLMRRAREELKTHQAEMHDETDRTRYDR